MKSSIFLSYFAKKVCISLIGEEDLSNIFEENNESVTDHLTIYSEDYFSISILTKIFKNIQTLEIRSLYSEY